MKSTYVFFKIVTTAIIVLIYTNGYSQFDEKASVIPPSPNAASIMKYANTPVNLYTGVPLVSAPLHTLSARGGCNIPIELYYHASGIKVQDMASSVGIGWSMSVNSVISRVVRGLPDENPNGYFGSSMGEKILHPLDAATLNGVYDGTLDAEPDLFFYNINGRYGKFVFNKNGNPVMLSDNGMRVLNSPFKKELGIDGWVMEDLQGNIYYLGTDAGSVEDTHSTAHSESSNTVLDFRSTWYLNKIVTPNNTETINFNYDSGNPITTTNYSKKYKSRRKISTTFNRGFYILGIPIVSASSSVDMELVDADTWSSNIDELVAAPKYLSSITTSNQNAYFSYDLVNPRQDQPNGRVLSKIEIKDYKNESLKSFVLNQDYIYSKDIDRLEDLTTAALNAIVLKINTGTQTDQNQAFYQLQALTQLNLTIDAVSELQYENQLSSIMGGGPVQSIPDSPEKYRLRLNTITMFSGDQTSSVPLFRFQYKNDVSLPPRNSRKMDHWGYYNNNTYGDFPDYNFDTHLSGSDPNTINNIMRSPDVHKMQANVLQKIIYETGAYKDIVLEPNQYFDPVSNTNQTGAGLRVAKIVDVGDADAPPIVASYKYAEVTGNSFGKLINLPPTYVITIEHNESQIPYVHVNWTPPMTGRSNSNVVNPTYFPPTDVIQAPAPSSLINMSSIITSIASTLLGIGVQQPHVSYTPFIIRNSVSFNSMFDLDGIAVGYSKVIVENNGEGKTINSFTDREDYPDLSDQLMVDANFNVQGRISPAMAPFTPPTSYAFARGHLKESEVYSQDGVLLKRVTNTYALQTTGESVKGFKIAMGKINTLNGAFQSYNTDYYNVGYYDMMSQALLLTSTKEENFEKNYLSPITQTVNYTYNSTYPMLVSSQDAQNSTGDDVLTNFKYVIDKAQVSYTNPTESAAADQLFSDGKYGILLQKTTQKNNTVINTNLVGYKNWAINGSTLTLPETIYQGFGPAAVPIRKYMSYDVHANPLVFTENNGIKISTVYNYNDLYPVAEIKNAQYNEFFYEDFENSLAGNVISGNAHSGSFFYNGAYQVNFPIVNNRSYSISYWYRSNSVWHFSGLLPYTGPVMLISQGDGIDDIVIKPIDAQVSNVTYNPLFGVTAKTDISRLTTKYAYDNFQRLTDIKDNNGNIIKHFDYHIASAIVPQIYFSISKTALFTKNDCTSGSGSVGVYTVPEGKYYSYISQSDADGKATNELSTKGQADINATGACLTRATYSLTYTTDSGLGEAHITITKSFNDGLRALCKVRVRYDHLSNGQDDEIDQDVQYEIGDDLQKTIDIRVDAGSYIDVDLLNVIYN